MPRHQKQSVTLFAKSLVSCSSSSKVELCDFLCVWLNIFTQTCSASSGAAASRKKIADLDKWCCPAGTTDEFCGDGAKGVAGSDSASSSAEIGKLHSVLIVVSVAILARLSLN